MRELLLKIMAVLAKISTLRKRLLSVLVDPCLYYCCTAHQALAALRSLCTQRAVQEQFDRCAWAYTMLYVNLYEPQLLYSSCMFRYVFLVHTVYVRTYVHTCTYVYTCIVYGDEVHSSKWLVCGEPLNYVHCISHTCIRTYMYVHDTCTCTCMYIHTHTHLWADHCLHKCIKATLWRVNAGGYFQLVQYLLQKCVHADTYCTYSALDN